MPLAGSKYKIANINQISGVAQLIPFHPVGSRMSEEDLRQWVVNSVTDVNSFGRIYYNGY